MALNRLKARNSIPCRCKIFCRVASKGADLQKGMWIIPTYLRSQSFLLSFHIFPISFVIPIHPVCSIFSHLTIKTIHQYLLRCCVIYDINISHRGGPSPMDPCNNCISHNKHIPTCAPRANQDIPYEPYIYIIFICTTCRLFCKLNLGCILPWFMCKVRTSRRTAKRWGSRFPAQLVGPLSHRNHCILYILFWVNILDSYNVIGN